jgi:hypothetical protein
MSEKKQFFEFPVSPISMIKENCILDTIVHALQNCIYPDFDYEKSWSKSNFSINNSEDTRATITYDDSYIVVGVRNDRLENYFGNSDDNYLVNLAPQQIKDIANKQTLQYLLIDKNNSQVPAISAFLWITDGKAFSQQSYSDLMKSGVETIAYLLFDKDKLMDYWKEYYEISENQISFVFEIYEAYTKLLSHNLNINRETIEKRYGHKVNNECIESFNEIGILVI